jgi:hypothetical protein
MARDGVTSYGWRVRIHLRSTIKNGHLLPGGKSLASWLCDKSVIA